MPILQQMDRRDRPSERTGVTTNTGADMDSEPCLALAKFYDEQPNDITREPKHNKPVRQIKRVQEPAPVVT